MTNRTLPRLRKSIYLLRRRWSSRPAQPLRLVVEKAKWLHGARSPVMLAVDDLTNAWHERAGGGWENGGDWGGQRRRPGSALRLLEDRLMKHFPEARVTFFTVAGPISPYTHHQPFSYAGSLDHDDESRNFFRSLADDARYELAYHGLNHGTSGDRSEHFLQEFQGFPSVAAAVEQTRRGLAVFERATGRVPTGGKYGGYAYNEFAEAAISSCGFHWWCRDWMARTVAGDVADGYYEPQFFGPTLVVSLPSTVHGHWWERQQIDQLLATRQVISIAEHIAGVRPDGRTQTPNIADDIDELRRLYAYLADKPVWHATGSEIAAYVVARERTVLYDVTADGFSLHTDTPMAGARLTLSIDARAICSRERPGIAVATPDGEPVDAAMYRHDRQRHQHVITIPVIAGRYSVRPVAA